MNRAGVPVNSLAGRFHVGRCAVATEFFVHVREFIEREHRNLDRVALSDRLEIKVFHPLIIIYKLNFKWIWLLGCKSVVERPALFETRRAVCV